MTKKKQKVAMPAGIRNKLMAATSMLLVASIMMVSSTYAWFTLSTAPEVTGITTSVGANGNLEIALLTTDTYANTENISSAVGDSSATAKTVPQANITWGNLVDLSDDSYGLSGITLQPAAANLAEGGSAFSSTGGYLQYPVYGADGRVDVLGHDTVSAIKADGVFAYSQNQTYGVRAVGLASNVSARTLAYNTAKGTISRSASSAARPVRAAISANQTQFIMTATKIAGSENPTYSAADIALMLAVAQGEKASLETIVNAYANVIYALLASNSETDEEFNFALTEINDGGFDLQNCTNASALAEKLPSIASSLTSALESLAKAQGTVKNAISVLSGANPANDDVKTAVSNLVGSSGSVAAYGADDDAVNLNASYEDIMANLQNGSIYVNGGALADIVAATGNFDLGTFMTIKTYAGTKNNQSAGTLAGLTALTGNAPAQDTSAAANITDFYGYIMDFAFRTNAADSYLKLQTAAANRVYNSSDLAEGQGTATQGAGSTVTYTLTDGMTAAQAETLLRNVRIVFFDPADGSIYANARLNDITAGANESTAKIQLYTSGSDTTYTAGKDLITVGGTQEAPTYTVNESVTIETETYPASLFGLTAGGTITAEEYGQLAGSSSVNDGTAGFVAADGPDAKIVALNQNVVKKVSVLVYLDGNTIKNADVVNAAKSGDLSLNLQFSSSANLVPMQNTALKNLTATTQTAEPATQTNSEPQSGNDGNG